MENSKIFNIHIRLHVQSWLSQKPNEQIRYFLQLFAIKLNGSFHLYPHSFRNLKRKKSKIIKNTKKKISNNNDTWQTGIYLVRYSTHSITNYSVVLSILWCVSIFRYVFSYIEWDTYHLIQWNFSGAMEKGITQCPLY